MPQGFVHLFAVVLLILAPGGCEKPSTFSELTAKQPEPPRTAATTPAAVPAAPAAQPSPALEPPRAPESDPAELIAEFTSRPSSEIGDPAFMKLASLEGIERIEALNLSGSSVTEKSLVHLPKFTGVRELDLSGVSLGLGSLERVGTMSQLVRLNLSRTLLSNDGCRHLANLVALADLDVSQSSIDDKAFEHFENFVNLERLNVSNTKVDGSGFVVFDRMGDRNSLKVVRAHHTRFGMHGFRYVKGWKQLEVLIVSQSGVDDEGLAFGVRGMTGLREIDLSRNSITDRGLRHLVPLKSLQSICLRNNQFISIQGVALLKGHKDLKDLDLEGTSCTDAVVGLLKKTCPDVQITLLGRNL